MPVNELEEHPYLDYYRQFEPVSTEYYKGIIIGSFPIYAVTNSIDINGMIESERLGPEASMRFFYGSNLSQFWKYVGNALENYDPRKVVNENLPSEVAANQCAKLLFDNRLLITDALHRSNRQGTSSEDTKLMVNSEYSWINEQKKLNQQIPSLLESNTGIHSIYFTSTMSGAKSPYSWFRNIIGDRLQVQEAFNAGNRKWSETVSIDFGNGDIRIYKLFFLPTPKTRGIYWRNKRLETFVNYIRAYQPDFFQEIDPISVNDHSPFQIAKLSELRETFLIACYRQALCYSNQHFDGQNVIIQTK